MLWLAICLMIPLGAIELCFPPTSLLFSVSVDFPKVLIGPPTLPARRGLHYKACLIVSVAGFRSVRPTEVNFQLAISEGMCFFPLLLQSSFLFLLTFPEKKLRSFFDTACVIFQFSEPYAQERTEKTIAVIQATCYECMDKSLSWPLWKILSDLTNIIDIVKCIIWYYRSWVKDQRRQQTATAAWQTPELISRDIWSLPLWMT